MTEHKFEEVREFINGCEKTFLEGKLERKLESTCNRMSNLLYGTQGKANIHGRRNGSSKVKRSKKSVYIIPIDNVQDKTEAFANEYVNNLSQDEALELAEETMTLDEFVRDFNADAQGKYSTDMVFIRIF